MTFDHNFRVLFVKNRTWQNTKNTMAENKALLSTPKKPKTVLPGSGEDIPLGLRPESNPTVVHLGENAPLIHGESEAAKSLLGISLSRLNLSRSLMKLRSATMTVSLIERPSDDRRANAFLAGWNVTNLIQGTGILGIPYAVKLGGWAAVVSVVTRESYWSIASTTSPSAPGYGKGSGSITRMLGKPCGQDGATGL